MTDNKYTPEYNQFYVDLPTADCIGNPDGSWANMDNFPTEQQAITFAREHFGADATGRVRLVSGVNFAKQDALEAAAPELLEALENLRKELREHIRFDVRKHFSLMTADVAAGTAIRKAKGEA